MALLPNLPHSLHVSPLAKDEIQALTASETGSIAFDAKQPPQERWRPHLHIIPAHGWVNDPCGPGYDPVHKVYHVGFQWNSLGPEWGNISWGVATSHDFLHWTISDRPSIEPSADDDMGGVFTGCVVPTNIHGTVDGTLVALYTSAQRLPIHYTLPYDWGSELVKMAVSTNSGLSWKRVADKPVLDQPPAQFDVTGWRDPFVAPWEEADRQLGLQNHRSESEIGGEKHKLKYLYGLISGGIRNWTATTFIYQIDAQDLAKWRYIGPLIWPGLNFNPSPKWTGDFGVNWEVCNFVPLSHEGRGLRQDFIICGVEGKKAMANDVKALGEFRAGRAQMWFCGELQRSGKAVHMSYKYGGRLDHGTLYACNSFWDPVTKQHIVFGWILEEDLGLDLRKLQGWAGALSLPRIIKLIFLTSVRGSLRSRLGDIGSIECLPAGDGRFDILTLGVVPDPRLKGYRSRKMLEFILQREEPWVGLETFLPCFSWELKISFSVSPDAPRVGFGISHGNGETTQIYFEPLKEQIVIDRSESSSHRGIRRCPESAPHTLFSFAAAFGDGGLTWENLDFHVFYDSSILEVFVNERTAISTRVYPQSGMTVGLWSIIEDDNCESSQISTVVSCSMWSLSKVVHS